jgi:hypothetical protein
VKLTSKYIIGEGEGGVSQLFLRLQSYSYGNIQNNSLPLSVKHLASPGLGSALARLHRTMLIDF